MFPNRVHRSLVAAAVLFGLSLGFAPSAHAGYWCNKAAEFQGHCDTCNAFCILEHWVSGE